MGSSIKKRVPQKAHHYDRWFSFPGLSSLHRPCYKCFLLNLKCCVAHLAMVAPPYKWNAQIGGLRPPVWFHHGFGAETETESEFRPVSTRVMILLGHNIIRSSVCDASNPSVSLVVLHVENNQNKSFKILTNFSSACVRSVHLADTPHPCLFDK